MFPFMLMTIKGPTWSHPCWLPDVPFRPLTRYLSGIQVCFTLSLPVHCPVPCIYLPVYLYFYRILGFCVLSCTTFVFLYSSYYWILPFSPCVFPLPRMKYGWKHLLLKRATSWKSYINVNLMVSISFKNVWTMVLCDKLNKIITLFNVRNINARQLQTVAKSKTLNQKFHLRSETLTLNQNNSRNTGGGCWRDADRQMNQITVSNSDRQWYYYDIIGL